MTRFRPSSANFRFYSTQFLLGAAFAVRALPAVAEEAAPKASSAAQAGVTSGIDVKTKPSSASEAKSPARSDATAVGSAAAVPPSPPAQAPVGPDTILDPTAVAAAELVAGRAAYTTGDYVVASEHFAKAQAARDSAEVQYWLAMALDLQGKTHDAYNTFEKLVANPQLAELPEEQQTQAKARFQVLAKIPAVVQVNLSPATAQLLVDGIAQAGSSPFSLKLSPGKHVLSVSGEGFETSETGIDVKPAESREETVTLKATAPPAKAADLLPTPPPPAAKNPVPAIVTLGVAGASAVVGSIFGISALTQKSKFDDRPTAHRADNVERDALIADMAFGVALTLGITGIVLLTTDEPTEVAAHHSPDHAKLSVAPFVSPTSAGAAAWLSF
jgi:PEGA domain